MQDLIPIIQNIFPVFSNVNNSIKFNLNPASEMDILNIFPSMLVFDECGIASSLFFLNAFDAKIIIKTNTVVNAYSEVGVYISKPIIQFPKFPENVTNLTPFTVSNVPGMFIPFMFPYEKECSTLIYTITLNRKTCVEFMSYYTHINTITKPLAECIVNNMS